MARSLFLGEEGFITYGDPRAEVRWSGYRTGRSDYPSLPSGQDSGLWQSGGWPRHASKAFRKCAQAMPAGFKTPQGADQNPLLKKKCISPQRGAHEKRPPSFETPGGPVDRGPKLTSGPDRCNMVFFGSPVRGIRRQKKTVWAALSQSS